MKAFASVTFSVTLSGNCLPYPQRIFDMKKTLLLASLLAIAALVACSKKEAPAEAAPAPAAAPAADAAAPAAAPAADAAAPAAAPAAEADKK
jgi:hypothetical protein